jgi:lysophospholipase L1-like esterase
VESTSDANRVLLSDQQIASIESKKVFFGHQSVGANIIQGLRDLMVRDPRLKLKIVTSADPESVPGPAVVESSIGQNGNPRSKDEAFAAILDKGLGRQGGIAMYKYCYVDIDASTNVQQMFENYREEIEALRVKYPLLKIVHITVPLTTVEPATKAWVKTLLGRATERDADAKRNEFNRRLRQTYAGRDPIFDLAEGESTSPDGSRSYFIRDNERVFTLASEYTTDGGHLNEAGRLAMAERLLFLLAII